MPLLSSRGRRSLIARSLFSLLASLRQLARREKVLPVEVRELPEVRGDAVAHLAVDAAEVVDVQPVEAVALVV